MSVDYYLHWLASCLLCFFFFVVTVRNVRNFTSFFSAIYDFFVSFLAFVNGICASSRNNPMHSIRAFGLLDGVSVLDSYATAAVVINFFFHCICMLVPLNFIAIYFHPVYFALPTAFGTIQYDGSFSSCFLFSYLFILFPVILYFSLVFV